MTITDNRITDKKTVMFMSCTPNLWNIESQKELII